MTVSPLDVEELARHLVGIGFDDDVEEDVVEEKLDEKYGIDLVRLAALSEALLPLCVCSTSPLTGRALQGFAVSEGNGHGRFLMKRAMDVPAEPAASTT